MERIPLAYTFGNHMHWVDMEWLWGYHVLPGSVRDMIHLCREAGIKGCVNFDGVGYEKLASEDPEAFAELKEAIHSGMIEPVGCSYGQPYGLFHGGESNIRQRIYGVRTCLRLFGVRPRTFWEEEFDFFPQLPQMLVGCGFTGASLYFQWTWHTPEIPRENVPVIQWEGHDGTRIPAATRNRLNLHQWPEDMDILLNELAANPPASRSLILQWLELMPSPDWMCRSELILPKLRELLEDERFDIQPVTLGEYLAEPHDAPVRNYSMDEVWHGMTLGKNGDRMREFSRSVEGRLLRAESLASTISLFGRPYRQWDVYPAWEIEEGWRHLLMAQHHDNDECEGLCGRVGETHYKTAKELASGALRCQWGDSIGGEPKMISLRQQVEEIGPFGWKPFGPKPKSDTSRGPWMGKLSEMPDTDAALAGFELRAVNDGEGLDASSMGLRETTEGTSMSFTVHASRQPEPGLNRSIQLEWRHDQPFEILTDQAYSIQKVNPTKSWPKKYPSGDWMTSEQWFETVDRPFTSLSLVDLVQPDGSGLLILHQTAQQWFKVEGGVRCILNAYDPWDEKYYRASATRFTVIPHGAMANSDRWRLANTRGSGPQPLGVILPINSFSPVNLSARNVVATAFYREIEEFSGRRLDTYAGRGMGYPFILRLVEFDGIGGDVEVTLPGPIAKAFKTNLLGEIEMELSPRAGDPNALIATPEELAPFGIRAETVTVPMRPHEIATLYLDLVPGRKVARDLDAKREVWATVHRTEPI